MILHTINKVSGLELCRELVADGDVVVLIEDGVYLALQELPFAALAIRQDLEARGLSDRSEVKSLDYAEMVRLCVEADKVCAWF